MTFDTRLLWQTLPILAQGLGMTIVLVAVSLAIASVVGIVACTGRLLGRGMLFHLSGLYIGLFRGMPETVLIFWLYYCGPLVFNGKLTAFESATAALAATAGAYLAEIFRAGIEAVPRGQLEAANALGLGRFHLIWDVLAPQAIRVMIPAFLGLVTLVIKNSALVSAVGVEELFYRASVLGGQNFHYFEMLTAAAILYFALIFPLSALVQRQEARLLARTR